MKHPVLVHYRCHESIRVCSGQELDSTKEDLAAKEVVVTGDVAQQVGQDNATNIINQAKMQIIGDNIQNADEIYNIVYNIAEQNGVSLSQDEIDTIVSLLQQIAQQNYDIQEMKQTLANIQQNLKTAEQNSLHNSDESRDEGEDITQNVDVARWRNVKETTEDPTCETGADTSRPKIQILATKRNRKYRWKHTELQKTHRMKVQTEQRPEQEMEALKNIFCRWAQMQEQVRSTSFTEDTLEYRNLTEKAKANLI
ncbi:MAG: DUF1002 domain-containing protein [Blautia obeum]